jgi:hypothetical protein
MADESGTTRRTIHFKFTLPGADPAQLLAMMNAAAPFYQFFGTRQRLLQNVDDPSRFIQVVEYEAPASLEVNRQRIASEPHLQVYLQAWRTMLPGAVEIDVYRDVEGDAS